MRYSRNDLQASCADGAALSLAIGVGESYLPAFVLALSANQQACGLVATVPVLAGAVMQLVSPYAVKHLRSYRTWVVGCAGFQGMSFLPLILAAWLGHLSLFWVFAIASVYWAAGLATGPAWNVWMESLVPARLRARFFARRAQLGQLGLLIGFIVGGLVLHTGAANGMVLGAFTALFVVAAASRLTSAWFLATQREPSPMAEDLASLRPAGLVGSLRDRTQVRLLVYMLAVQLAVWTSAPYFTPFMLAHLGLSYGGFMMLSCGALVVKVLCLPTLGRLCRQWGANRTLWLSGSLIACVPALWIVDGGFLYLLLLQLVGGTIWAAFELAMLLTFFESIPKHQRLGLLTVFNVGNAAAIALGAVAGGVLLGLYESCRGGYYLLFALSTVARVLPLLLLIRMPRLTVRRWFLATRSIAVRPSMGTLERPVLAGLPLAEQPPPKNGEGGNPLPGSASPESANAFPETATCPALSAAVAERTSATGTSDTHEIAM